MVNGSRWEWTGDRWRLVGRGTLDPVQTRHLRTLLNGFHGTLSYETTPGYDPDPPQGHAARAARWLRAHGWDATARPVRDPDDGLPDDTVYGGAGTPNEPQPPKED
jgi:hypothetical protein